MADYVKNSGGTANKDKDHDLVKVVLRWPKGIKVSGAKLSLTGTGMQVDGSKKADSSSVIEKGDSHLNFYKEDGTKLIASDLKIDDLGNPGSGYLAQILTTGTLTLFIEGGENFGYEGSTVKEGQRLGGAVLKFEFKQNSYTATQTQRLLVYRGGFLAFRLPQTNPRLPEGGVLGTLEFWDGKGRVKHKWGGKGKEFQEDVTDWGNKLASWAARSGYENGRDYNTTQKANGGHLPYGHTPPGWRLVAGAARTDFSGNQSDHNETDGDGTTYLKQGGYCRWIADDATDPAMRYQHNFKYYASNPHDHNIGDPRSTRIRFKFDTNHIPPGTSFKRTDIQIHPDGKRDGTAGCIGIQTMEDCRKVYSWLSAYSGLKLKVQFK